MSGHNWNKSRLARDWGASTVKWNELTPSKQQRFAEGYLGESGRAERMRVFAHAKTERQHRLLELLYTYQTSRRERARKGSGKVENSEEESRGYLV